MTTWQIVITTCAGFITILTLFEKLGITSRLRRADADVKEVRQLITSVNNMTTLQKELMNLQKDQNNALLAILRNELYKSFKTNRDIEAWTDDECAVQTKLHAAYKALYGNGEEDIWWEKKKTWRIVSNEEYQELICKTCE